MFSLAFIFPLVYAIRNPSLPLLTLLGFFLFFADVVSLLLSYPHYSPFLLSVVYVSVRVASDFLAFCQILPPHLRLARFMFPQIPGDALSTYPASSLSFLLRQIPLPRYALITLSSMSSPASIFPVVYAFRNSRFLFLTLLSFYYLSADVVSLLLSYPRYLPFLLFVVYVFVRLAFDFLAFYHVLSPRLHLAHFMFPRIPDDPHYVYPIREPESAPVDFELLMYRIDRQIAKSKFYRDRAAQRKMLKAQLKEEEDLMLERESREASGIFGPMDERYFPKYRARKHDSKWGCLEDSISQYPSDNYGGGTVIRSANEARGNTGQLTRRRKPKTSMPWPQPAEVAISRGRLKLHASLHPYVVQEVKRNMARAEAERKSQIPPPHLKGVARAYWLIQMKRRLKKPYFVNPLYDVKSELTGKAPDGRIYDSSDY